MKKAAIFVEGQTEQIFVERLLIEMAGQQNIAFHLEQWNAKQFIALKSDPVSDQQWFVIIIDCRGDGAVVSAIRSRYQSLIGAGYDLVLGLRDLYPMSHNELPLLQAGIASVLPVGNPPATIVVAVAEVESWFVQENTHYARIDANLTQNAIFAATGFDINAGLAESLAQPSATLDQAYGLVGMRYTKKKSHVGRTVGALDFEHLYLDRRQMLNSFNEFANQIEIFLTN